MKLSPQVKKYEYERICELIELLISVHPQGFGILLGEAAPPDSREINEMLNTLRSPNPPDFKPTQKGNFTHAERLVIDEEYFNEAVRMAGGWEHINFCSRELKVLDPRLWNVAADHVKFVANPSSRYLSRLNYVANKHGISRNTAIRYRRLFPQILAVMLLAPDYGYCDVKSILNVT